MIPGTCSPFVVNLLHAPVLLSTNQHIKFKVPSHTHSKDNWAQRF